jgi:uncharacterized RDD family membrane protein YckC
MAPRKSKSRRSRKKRIVVDQVVESAVVATPQPDVKLDLPFASPFLRIYAGAVDILMLGTLFVVLAFASDGYFANGDATVPQDIILFFGYLVIPTGLWGQTPGKWAAGISVVDKDGRVPGVAMAIPREMVGRFVATIVGGIGLAWVVWDPNRQGWHDKIAGTFVVRKPNATAPGPLKIWGRLPTRKDR